MEFVDSDREIEKRTGADISLIFELEGEAGFRKRERAIIGELTARAGVVLATGGGAILDPDNRAHLTARGRVIYLHCPVAQQMERTAHDRSRPLLETADRQARLEALMAIRDPLYREVADLIVDTDRGNIRSVVKYIIKQHSL